MKYLALRQSIFLLILVLLDVTRLAGYSLKCEFALLGFIFTVLHYPLKVALIVAFVLGFVLDALSFHRLLSYTVEFALFALIGYYVMMHFRRNIVKMILVLIFLFIHAGIASLLIRQLTVWDSFQYLVHSLLLYLFLTSYIKPWLISLSEESTSPLF